RGAGTLVGGRTSSSGSTASTTPASAAVILAPACAQPSSAETRSAKSGASAFVRAVICGLCAPFYHRPPASLAGGRVRREGGGMRGFAPCALVVAILTSGCDCGGGARTQRVRPHVTVDPAAIDFGPTRLGTAAERVVTVRNDGDATTALSLPRFATSVTGA